MKLTMEAKRILTEKGYTLRASLGVPGAFGFEAEYDGRRVPIGIKTAADRWMSIPRNAAGEFGLLEKIDRLFVVTFDAWPNATKFQLWEFDPAEIIDKAKRAYAEAARLKQAGLQFLAFDDDFVRRPSSAKAAGHLTEVGKLIFEEVIEWTKEESEKVETTEDSHPSKLRILPKPKAPAHTPEEPPASVPRKLTLQEAKEGLAAAFGVSPESIEITIRG
jgi:hypothetical protein